MTEQGQSDDADDLSGDFDGVGVGRGDLGELGGNLLCEPAQRLSYWFAVWVSAAWPALAKWLVPVVHEPGTTMTVSMPKRATSAA